MQLQQYGLMKQTVLHLLPLCGAHYACQHCASYGQAKVKPFAIIIVQSSMAF